jgi:hypothetical protein
MSSARWRQRQPSATLGLACAELKASTALLCAGVQTRSVGNRVSQCCYFLPGLLCYACRARQYTLPLLGGSTVESGQL